MSPEYESSWEHLSSEERREKIAAHIAGMRIGRRVLEEGHAQQEAIQDFEARSYQLDAFNALWTARKDGADRGLIHLATGLGKTSVAVVDYAAFRQQRIEETGQEPRALFVVHQNNILEQASERFSELMPDTNRVFYSNRQKKLPDNGVIFASFQTLTNGAHRFPADYFDYIIYDEAHHIEAKTYKKVVEHFKPKFQLGLTATPERMDEKDITDHFGEALYVKTLPEAIAENHLATVNYNIVFDDAVKEAMLNNFALSTVAEIQRLFEVESRNEVIVEKIRNTQDKIKQEQGTDQVKTIIFCADVEHADSIAELTGGESYHSGKDDKAQARILDAFRKGGLETIAVRDMFNEGVDIPDARLIVFLRTTQSSTVFEQQLGRGLRKNKDKQEVTVLDFVANIERIVLVRNLVEEIDRSQSSSGGSSGGNGPIICGTNGEIKVHGTDSEFIFSQETIDLLEKYLYLVDQKEARREWNDWTNEEVVVMARKFSPDKPLRSVDIRALSKEDRFPSVEFIHSRFKNLAGFQQACGFDVDAYQDQVDWSEYTKDEVVELAKRICPDGVLKKRDISDLSVRREFPGLRIITNMFGSLLDFQRACGYDVKEKTSWQDVSDDELITRAVETSPDKPLGAADIDLLARNRLFPSMIVIKQRFGSIVEFQQACGFDVVKRTSWADYTDDQLVEIVKNLSLTEPLTYARMTDFRKRGVLPSMNLITNRFGSLAEFNKRVGLS